MKRNIIVLSLLVICFGVFSVPNIYYYDGSIVGGLGRRSYEVNECKSLPPSIKAYREQCHRDGGYVMIEGDDHLWRADVSTYGIEYVPLEYDRDTGVIVGERRVFTPSLDFEGRGAFVDDFFMTERQAHLDGIKAFIATKDLETLPGHVMVRLCKSLQNLLDFGDRGLYSKKEVSDVAQSIYEAADVDGKAFLKSECGVELFSGVL